MSVYYLVASNVAALNIELLGEMKSYCCLHVSLKHIYIMLSVQLYMQVGRVKTTLLPNV